MSSNTEEIWCLAGHAFIGKLLGENNFERWCCLRKKLNFSTEMRFATWLLDLAEAMCSGTKANEWTKTVVADVKPCGDVLSDTIKKEVPVSSFDRVLGNNAVSGINIKFDESAAFADDVDSGGSGSGSEFVVEADLDDDVPSPPSNMSSSGGGSLNLDCASFTTASSSGMVIQQQQCGGYSESRRAVDGTTSAAAAYDYICSNPLDMISHIERNSRDMLSHLHQPPPVHAPSTSAATLAVFPERPDGDTLHSPPLLLPSQDDPAAGTSCDILVEPVNAGSDIYTTLVGGTGGKRYSCAFCDYRSYYKSHMARHTLKHQDGGQAPFQCPYCPYGSVWRGHLDSHIRTHTGERPFRCNMCAFASKQKNDLVRHQKNRHGCQFAPKRRKLKAEKMSPKHIN